MRNYTCSVKNKFDAVECFGNAITQLKSNEWEASIPLILDGIYWKSDIERDEISALLFKSLNNNDSLQEITIQNLLLCLKAESALHEMFKYNKGITSVQLRNLKDDNNGSLMVPMTMFKSISKIQSISLEKVCLDENSAIEFAKMMQHSSSTLKNVSINHITLRCSVGWTKLTTALSVNTSLESVVVNNMNHMKISESHRLLSGISMNQHIQSLQLDNMNLDYEHSTYIAHLVAVNPVLKSLSLRKNNLKGDAIRTIVDGLRQNTRPSALQTLLLSDNPIGNDGVVPIIEYLLQDNCKLKSLCLMNCEIWYDGCQQLASGLAEFSSLREIYLDGNEIELCGQTLLNSVRRNTIIQEILHCMPQTRSLQSGVQIIDETIWHDIDFYLRTNRANRHELLKIRCSNETKSLPGCIAHFLSKECIIQQPDVLFYFLNVIP